MKKFELFETQVRDLLRLHGWHVENEQLLGHKKVDSIITKIDEFGSTIRLAVECKFYERKLRQNEVSSIYANYLPLIQSHLIAGILLVTELGIHPSAETFVRSASNFTHATRTTIQDNVMDFTPYVLSIVQKFEKSEVSQYYIPQRPLGSDCYYTEYISQYIQESSRSPIAILGGYGTGKTCLAHFLSTHFAKLYLNDRTQRIPVVINLGNMSSDQSLEGLLGRIFTSESVIRNFNFGHFMALNEMGRFLLILDGFDEMRRLMSWDSLLFNLSELNRLLSKRAKAILLGRPTIFLDEDEQRQALHGIKQTRMGERRVPNWPEFEELHVRFFSRTDMSQFVTRYSNMLRASPVNQLQDKVFVDLQKAIQHGKGTLLDVIERPMQLKMLTEILPDFKGSINDLTVSELYSEFFDLVVRRESEKRARTRFSESHRKEFIKELALFMWRNDRMSTIKHHEIPQDLMRKFCSKDDDIEAVKRDLIVGSILERKDPEGFYFSHRSFQEYLVAEQLFRMFVDRDIDWFNIYDLSAEIREFYIDILGSASGIKFKNWIMARIGVSRAAFADSNRHDLMLLLEELCEHYGVMSPFSKERTRARRSSALYSEGESAHDSTRAVGILSIAKKIGELRSESESHERRNTKDKKVIKRDYSRKS